VKKVNNIVEKMIEVDILDEENFLKIKETLTRIGIPSKKNNTLYQSCHILHKGGKYYIVHFKEMFLLDEKQSNIDEEDIARRNTIILLLQEWNLLKVKKGFDLKDVLPISKIKILTHKEKSNWILEQKYNIGKKK
jgi:hypothetical protein